MGSNLTRSFLLTTLSAELPLGVRCDFDFQPVDSVELVSGESAVSMRDTCWSWSARLTAVLTTWLEAMLLFTFVWIVVLIPVDAFDFGLAWPSAVVLAAAGVWLATFRIRALRVSVAVDRLTATLCVRNVYRSDSLAIASITSCRVRGPWQFRRGGWGLWAPTVVLVDDDGREVPITASITDRQARRSDMLQFLRSARVSDLPTREEYVRSLGRYVGRATSSNR